MSIRKVRKGLGRNETLVAAMKPIEAIKEADRSSKKKPKVNPEERDARFIKHSFASTESEQGEMETASALVAVGQEWNKANAVDRMPAKLQRVRESIKWLTAKSGESLVMNENVA